MLAELDAVINWYSEHQILFTDELRVFACNFLLTLLKTFQNQPIIENAGNSILEIQLFEQRWLLELHKIGFRNIVVVYPQNDETYENQVSELLIAYGELISLLNRGFFRIQEIDNLPILIVIVPDDTNNNISLPWVLTLGPAFLYFKKSRENFLTARLMDHVAHEFIHREVELTCGRIYPTMYRLGLINEALATTIGYMFSRVLSRPDTSPVTTPLTRFAETGTLTNNYIYDLLPIINREAEIPSLDELIDGNFRPDIYALRFLFGLWFFGVLNKLDSLVNYEDRGVDGFYYQFSLPKELITFVDISNSPSLQALISYSSLGRSTDSRSAGTMSSFIYFVTNLLSKMNERSKKFGIDYNQSENPLGLFFAEIFRLIFSIDISPEDAYKLVEISWQENALAVLANLVLETFTGLTTQKVSRSKKEAQEIIGAHLASQMSNGTLVTQYFKKTSRQIPASPL